LIGQALQQIPLSRAALSSLARPVGVPAYDPASVTAGIVHLGFGGFHRAHMARYTHDLMQGDPDALGWGVVGAGLLPADRRMVEALGPQDGLYTLVERDGGGEVVTVIGCVAGLIFAAEDSSDLLEAIDAPDVRIVSLTVTEHGYCLNAATKRLDPDHPAIVADLADPARPHTAVGILVEALRRRRDAGHRAFTGLSCDNIQHNGRVLKAAVLDFARLRDPTPVGEGLADWIAREARFPDTMVDRITPATRPEDTAALAIDHGVIDAWPVFAEPFRQWVITDDFADGRPDWERVGARFVPDVAPYETMKLRLLNASHLAVAGLGRLMGYVFVDETMRDVRIARYMAALMDRETGPTVPPVPGVDLNAYKASLIERFANPTIKDTVERVNTDAPLNYLIDPIRDRLARNEGVSLLALAVAAWIRRMTGVDEAGAGMVIRHPLADLLRERALEGGPDPRPVLGIESLFGEVGRDARFVAAVGERLASLHTNGVAATLTRAEAEGGF
jgi:mannitol 2-dehydrogenase